MPDNHSDMASGADLERLAEAALLFNSTAVDERGVGIDHAMKTTFAVDEPDRLTALGVTLGPVDDSVSAFTDWLSSPFAAAVRQASAAKGHPFYMNAPLTALLWIGNGCPGLVAKGTQS